MNIRIDNFCSLNHIEFTIKQGINILAGKNGSGKSQLLMAIAHQYGNQTLKTQGFENINMKTVNINPKPKKALWRPPIRKIGDGTRGTKYSTLTPPYYLTDRNKHSGYTYGVDERFFNLHNTLTRIYVAGSIEKACVESMEIWKAVKHSFKNVFNKEIEGEFNFNGGGRVGLKIETDLSAFDTLSTGELEYLSLMCDLLTEKDVDFFLIDEIDAHFHPDLQKKLVSEINNLIKEKTLLLTTHSPSLMLSVPPENLFFLKNASEVSVGQNQITCLAEDFTLMESISEMYAGFINDIRLSNHYFQSANFELLKYSSECLKDSNVIGQEKASDSDPQTIVLRAVLLTAGSQELNIVEIGVGKGRLLESFKVINDEQLKRFNYLGIDYKAQNLEELQNFANTIGITEKFKSFTTSVEFQSTNKFDLLILANIIHEVGPDKLMEFFNSIFLASTKNSKILILEALELAVGERRYVLFDDIALNEIFKRNIQANKIFATSAKPQSHSGTPLLEYSITFEDDPISITNMDIKNGLESIIRTTSKEISEHIQTEILNGRSLAFKCHNLANASAYLDIIK